MDSSMAQSRGQSVGHSLWAAMLIVKPLLGPVVTASTSLVTMGDVIFPSHWADMEYVQGGMPHTEVLPEAVNLGVLEGQ